MQDDVLILVSNSFSEDEIGQQKPVEVRREVFCRVGGISRREWFDAGHSGLKPELMFSVFFGDYCGEKTVEYNGDRYTVYRTYRADPETVELYCERRTGA